MLLVEAMNVACSDFQCIFFDLDYFTLILCTNYWFSIFNAAPLN